MPLPTPSLEHKLQEGWDQTNVLPILSPNEILACPREVSRVPGE